MKGKTVIGIDGGKSGAIAVAQNGSLDVFKMPATAKDLKTFFTRFDPEETLIFIEKVSAFVGEDSARKYAIIKMLGQLKELHTVLQMMEFTFVELAPVTWQSRLNLRFKGMEKAQRKTKYFEFAKRYADKTKVLKYAGDSVCILACGLKLLRESDPLVSDKNLKQTNLF